MPKHPAHLQVVPTEKTAPEEAEAKPINVQKPSDICYWPLLIITPKWVTPNQLSALRLLMCIPIIVMMWEHYYKPTAVLFIFAAILDGLDGALARKIPLMTEKGAWLDPLADKVVNAAVWLGFLFYTGSDIYTNQLSEAISTALITTIISIDACLFVVASAKYLIKNILPTLPDEHWLQPQTILNAVKVEKTGANNFGKVKMVVQVIVLSALLIFNPETAIKLREIFTFLPPHLRLLEISYPLLMACIILGGLSFYGHVKVMHFKKTNI